MEGTGSDTGRDVQPGGWPAREMSLQEMAARLGATPSEAIARLEAYLRAKLPPREAELRAPVGARATIHWDSWGIAHLQAESIADLYFALGYAMAQERLWQLDYMRRLARGELAAVLGVDALASDRYFRTIGLGRSGETAAASLPEEVSLVLEALSAGINAWTDRAVSAGVLPFEFDLLEYEPSLWRPADSISVWKYRWWTLTGRLEKIVANEIAHRHLPPELLAAFSAVELGEETIVPGSVAGPVPGSSGWEEGSNNWVVGGARTTTGSPVLCSDPHNPFGNPSQWFEAQLISPGMDAAGVIYCGTPGIYIGRNRDVAWGLTNHAAPVRDIFIEETKPDDPRQYRDGDVWRSFEVEHQEIEVRDGQAEALDIRRTVRGPIINELLPDIGDTPEPPLSLAWVGAGLETGFDAMLGLQRATSASDVLEALKIWPCPPLNFVYADRAGHIGYHAAGWVPRRAAGARGFRRAGNPEDAWQGYHAFDSLPNVADPEQGWVATANNVPWQKDGDYVSMGDWSPGYRHRRIRERLEAGGPMSPAEIGAVQADAVDARGVDLGPVVVRLVSGCGDVLVQRAVAVLAGWDGLCAIDSLAASVFAAFWNKWTERVARARFPERVVPLMSKEIGGVARRCLLESGIGWFADGNVEQEARKAFIEAVAWLKDLAGPRVSDWKWGPLHAVTFAHPLGRSGLLAQRLNIGPYPTPGGADTVRATGYEGRGDAPFTVLSGSTYRFLADLSAPDRAWSVITSGQSAHPASPHYADQTDLWLADERRPLWMSGTEVLANLEGTTVLLPAETPGSG